MRMPEELNALLLVSYGNSVQLSIELFVCVCVKSLSRVRLFATPWTVARQAPLSN